MTDSTTLKIAGLPDFKLESPEGYQVWERKMEQYLIHVDLWKFTTEKEATFPSRISQTDADRVVAANAAAQVAAGVNEFVEPAPIPEVQSLADYELRLERWENKHLRACNAIKSTLGVNYYNDHKGSSNACFLWIAIKQGCKPKGSGTLNDRYRRLLDLKLSDFTSASEYAGKFKETHNDIRNMHEELRLNENFLIFLFHTGLGKEHEDYFLHYTQNHASVDAVGKPAFSLEYATQRFIQTVTNPTATRGESNLGMIAARQEAYVGTSSALATLPTVPGQQGAVEGPDAQYVKKLVKYCRNCKRHFHTQHDCAGQNGNPQRRRRSRSRSRSRHGTGREKRQRTGRDNDRDRGRNNNPRGKDSKRRRSKPRKTRHDDHDAYPAYYDSAASGSDASDREEYTYEPRDCFVGLDQVPECYVSATDLDIGSLTSSEGLEALAATKDGSKRWGLDSCCSMHATPDRSMFKEYRDLTDKDDRRAIGGIGGKLPPVGIGSVELKVNVNGKCRILALHNVSYIPGLPINLISQGLLMRSGCPIKIVDGGIEIGRHGITAWLTTSNIYCLDLWEDRPQSTKPGKPAPTALVGANPIDGPIVSPAPVKRPRSVSCESESASSSATDCESQSEPSHSPAASARSESDSGISDCEDARPKKKRKPNPETVAYYHRCLGHSGDVEQLTKYGINLSKAVNDRVPCTSCVIKKLTQVRHTSHIRPGRRRMDLVHSDIGQMKKIKNGQQFFITFMDDYTKRSEVEIIDSKDEAFPAFLRYLKRNEIGDCRCRRLRTDWGGEYSDHAFDDWRANHGMMWEPIVPKNPEQNGSSERLNQDLKGCVFTVMEETGLSNEFWPHLILAANYLRNRRPTQSRKLTPYEAETGCKPSLKHLRPLGSYGWCIARKPATGWKTGQSRVHCDSPARLIGYEGDHIYRMLLPNNTVFRTARVIWGKVPPSFLRIKKPKPPAVGGTSPPPSASLPPSAQPAKGSTIQLEIDNDWDELGPSNTPAAPPIVINQPQTLTPAGTPSTPASTPASSGTASGTVVGNTPSTPLRNHPYLQDRSLSPDPIALFGSITREPNEPKTYEEATADNNPYGEEWMFATDEEIDSLIKNGTWELVDCPPDRRPLKGKWVFTLKRGPKGEITRYKARWVVLGCSQREGLDYNETFATVVKPMSYKALFALAAALNWDLEQMDVKTAFLYGAVEEVIYVIQPTGYKSKRYPGKVCRLKKALYGLKQSPRVWYQTFVNFMRELGLFPISADYSVFTDPRTGTIVALYVDDVLVTGPNRADILRIKKALSAKFHMTDLGACAYYLGMTLTRDRTNRIIRLGQAAYVERILREHGMWDAKSVSTPIETSAKLVPAEDGYQAEQKFKTRYQSAVGSLMYAMLGTRPDIAYAVSVVSRYAHNPTNKHWGAVKRILAYLKGTVHMELTFQGTLSDLIGYTDSDWAGDTATRRSTSGYVFNIGSAAISWSSKRQATVALSTCEAEYIGQTQATKEAIWLRSLLTSLRPDCNTLETVIIYGDNQGAIALSKDPRSHGRTKHIDIANHFCREKVADKSVAFEYTPTDKQVADGLTKALARDKFEAFRDAIGLR